MRFMLNSLASLGRRVLVLVLASTALLSAATGVGGGTAFAHDLSTGAHCTTLGAWCGGVPFHRVSGDWSTALDSTRALLKVFPALAEADYRAFQGSYWTFDDPDGDGLGTWKTVYVNDPKVVYTYNEITWYEPGRGWVSDHTALFRIENNSWWQYWVADSRFAGGGYWKSYDFERVTPTGFTTEGADSFIVQRGRRYWIRSVFVWPGVPSRNIGAYSHVEPWYPRDI